MEVFYSVENVDQLDLSSIRFISKSNNINSLVSYYNIKYNNIPFNIRCKVKLSNIILTTHDYPCILINEDNTDPNIVKLFNIIDTIDNYFNNNLTTEKIMMHTNNVLNKLNNYYNMVKKYKNKRLISIKIPKIDERKPLVLYIKGIKKNVTTIEELKKYIENKDDVMFQSNCDISIYIKVDVMWKNNESYGISTHLGKICINHYYIDNRKHDKQTLKEKYKKYFGNNAVPAEISIEI